MKGTLFDHVFKFIDIQCKHSGLVRTVQSHRCLQAVVKLLPCALERAKVLLCTRGRSSQLRRTGIRRRTRRVAGKKGRDQDLRYSWMSLLIYSVLKWGDHLFWGWECSEALRKLLTEGKRQKAEFRTVAFCPARLRFEMCSVFHVHSLLNLPAPQFP